MAPPSAETLEGTRPRPMRTRSAPAVDGASPTGPAATGSTILFLFLCTLMIPANIFVGGVQFTPYRIFLIFLFVPLLLRLLRDREHPVNIVDLLFAAYASWVALSVLYNHGTSRITWIAGTALDEMGAYLVGRTLVRTGIDYRLLFRYLLWCLLFLLPFALIELLTRRNVLFDVVSLFATPNPKAGQAPRLGLNRVQTVFHHSILFGAFCSVCMVNFFYIYKGHFFRRWYGASLAALMTFMSLSSAPIIAMGIQVSLILWDRLTRFLRWRWVVLAAGAGVALAVIQLTLENGLIGLVIENATFDPMTGWGRTEILRYGTAEALRHPLFGIGFNEWERPYWKKASVDNFWIGLAMRHGLPAAFFLLLALLIHCALVAASEPASEDVARYRTGYLISWAGLFFTLWTVMLFSALTPFVMAYFGAGVWFYAGRWSRRPYARLGSRANSDKERPSGRRRPGGSRAAPGRTEPEPYRRAARDGPSS
jgi:O-Antigen ligase